MAENDYPGLLQACLRLGDTSKGGDPQLWTVVLEYLTAKEDDVSKEVSYSPPPFYSLFTFYRSSLV